MSTMRIIRAGLVVLVLIILLSTAFLAGMGNTRTLQEAAYEQGLADGALAGPPAAAPAEIIRAPEMSVVSGTVTTVSAASLELTDESGTAQSFSLDANTVLVALVEQSEKTITVADIAPGDAVAVTRDDGSDRAIRIVRLMRAAAPPAP